MARNGRFGPQRVVLVAEFDARGGPYKNLLRVVRSLLDMGSIIDVFPCNPEYSELAELAEETAGLTIHRDFSKAPSTQVWVRPLRYLLEAFFLARTIRHRLRGATDLLFSITSPGRFFWHFPRALRPTYIFRSYPIGPLHRLARIWFPLLISRNARLVGVSEFTRDEIARVWGINVSAVEFGVLPNTSALEGYSVSTARADYRQVLMVGRLHEHKNPFLWLRVASEIVETARVEVQFVWLGDGPLRNECVSLVRELGLSNNVTFPGFVDNPGEYYSQSNLYLHLAQVEPMSNALLDAICVGLPCVVSAAGGNPELVKDGYNGIVTSSENLQDIGRAAALLLESQSQMERMGRNSRVWYQENFSNSLWQERFNALMQRD